MKELSGEQTSTNQSEAATRGPPSRLRPLSLSHLGLVHVDPVSVVIEAAVQGSVVVEETLKVQRGVLGLARPVLKVSVVSVNPNA